MSRIRLCSFISLFLLSGIFTGIGLYLNHKSEKLSSRIWSEYLQFQNTNGTVIGREVHFSDENRKEASRLLLQVLNSKESMILKRYKDETFLSFLFSIVLFLVSFLVLAWGLLKKCFCYLFKTPQRAIITLAISFFAGSFVFPPFNHAGHIHYSFFFNPIWNGSEIFWALLLVEWTVALLPLGLLYKRYVSDKIVNIQQ